MLNGTKLYVNSLETLWNVVQPQKYDIHGKAFTGTLLFAIVNAREQFCATVSLL